MFLNSVSFAGARGGDSVRGVIRAISFGDGSMKRESGRGRSC